jgi:phosphate acetyltransferase
MGLIDRFVARAKKTATRVVFPEAEDERVVRAAVRLAAQRIAHPILIAPRGAVARPEGCVGLEGVTVLDPTESPSLTAYCKAYAARRGLTARVAERLIRRPLYFGAMMVSEGEADAVIAGASRPTAQVIAAGVLAIGLEAGVTLGTTRWSTPCATRASPTWRGAGSPGAGEGGCCSGCRSGGRSGHGSTTVRPSK